MLARIVLVCLLVGACGAPAAPGGRPPASASEARPAEVAIAEPSTDNAVDEEDPPAGRNDEELAFAGEWIEDWPNRGGCADRVVVRLDDNGAVELSGKDCNDGEPYEYSEIAATPRTLRFTLRVPSTERVLHYDLELRNDELVGEVTGGAEATVTWRRTE